MCEVSIAWVDLSYKVKNKFFGENKIILHRLNGFLEFGCITALMGASGAGKTTLLKFLNGKLSSGIDPNSKIYVNSDQKINRCFVSQNSEDQLIMCLTVKQNLIYASKLKNSDVSPERQIDHELNVTTTMEEFMISNIFDTPVRELQWW